MPLTLRRFFDTLRPQIKKQQAMNQILLIDVLKLQKIIENKGW
nr:MAG TPA: hypothetical protein [Caudoviricetes sp.]